MIPDFAAVFGGVGDGVTNNDAAFNAAEASSYERIWLPEGRFFTTRLSGSFTKRYEGPGKIYLGVGNGSVQGGAWYSGNAPIQDPAIAYGLSDDTKFSDVEHKVLKAGSRKNFNRILPTPSQPYGAYPPYFWAPSTPKFARFINQGGWSGLSGRLAANAGVGATTAQIAGGVTGWNVGDTIGFVPGNQMDGRPADIVTVTAVNTGAGTITFSPALTNAYTVDNVVSHGYRTMNPYQMVVLDHRGGGDSYAWCAQVEVSYNPLPSQTAFENTATGGLIGGALVLSTDGVYGTGWECQYTDGGVASTTPAGRVVGKDVGVAGSVNSYIRTNNTAARSCFWIHDLAKMDGGADAENWGLKPLDGVWVYAGAARVGLDLTRSSYKVAAVALPLNQKITFDAGIVSPGPTNGHGWVATTTNNMYITGEQDAASKYLYLRGGGTAGVVVRPSTLQLVGNTAVAGTLSVSSTLTAGGITGSSLNVSGATSLASLSSGSIVSSGDIVAGAGTIRGKYLTTQQKTGSGSHLIMFGDQTTGASYLIVDTVAGQAALYVNGVQKAAWL